MHVELQLAPVPGVATQHEQAESVVVEIDGERYTIRPDPDRPGTLLVGHEDHHQLVSHYADDYRTAVIRPLALADMRNLREPGR